MAKKFGKNPLTVSIFYLLLLQSFCNTQRSIEVSKCTQYKRQVFERVRTFSFFMIGAAENEVVEDNCKNHSPFIVEGTPAEPKEFPHIARLGNSKPDTATNWLCGGTLISDRFVLTAAHCFYSEDAEVNIVRLGDLVFDTSTDDAEPEDFGVKRYIIHPNYKDEENYFDIGLVELDRAVTFNAYKHPACLPIDAGNGFDKLVAIGWGSTSFTTAASKSLLKVKLDRYNFNQCHNYMLKNKNEQFPNGIDDSSQLCAGSLTTRRDTCSGDSGGPLLAYHTDYPCMYFVVGVTSFGVGGCGTAGIPGVYTRVYNFMDWIKQYVWQ